MNRGERSWSDAWFRSNETLNQVSVTRMERLRNFIRRGFVLITLREGERSCSLAKQVEVFRSVKWTEIITSLDENKY